MFSEDIEKSITTPHSHEGEHNPPLWLIWSRKKGRTGLYDFPALDTVGDTEHSARYHVNAVLETPNTIVSVERIPANHRFGSSIPDLQTQTHIALWRKRLETVDGD